ncbi:YeeE/YedE family protein [Variovorax ginsengisoli]|uniref:Membrane protein YedE/YeeE n=1 Tax=Variovorax ginsengisoli TaxID=363844 RepID=A0ABT9S529_9BURK|nr:YeeE/YedE family protein [Variovorax ginsengisoli]MDP9899460.1 putative membrane protein YedE/YeeE [Variovorax ginsengisoli]
MTIDWTHFTPWSSLAGGALIGLSAALFMAFNGRIAGISGVLGGLIGRSASGDRLWRAVFIVGLLLAVPLWRMVHALPGATIDAGAPALVAAGLLVGIGTRYAAGCTSGHGVCGLSRGSPRSMAATAAFMGAGFVTVFVLRHLGSA